MTDRDFILQPVPQRTAKKHYWPWILGGTLLMVLALCAGAVSLIGLGGTSGAVMDGLNSSAPVAPKTSGQAGAAKPKQPTVVQIGEGMWKVGTTMKPGQYKTSGAQESAVPMCYWDLRTTTSADSIVAGTQGLTDSQNAPQYVTVKKGQYFKTMGCNPWVPVK